MPRYHQIAQTLARADRPASQRPASASTISARLAEDFGVTLMTLRQALEVLEREGLITRRHGLGTFVARARPSTTTSCNFRALRRGPLGAVGEDVATRFLRSHFAARRPARGRGARTRPERAGLRARAAPARGRRADELPGLVPARRARRGGGQGRPRRDAAPPGADLQARHRDHAPPARPSPRCPRPPRRARARLPLPALAAFRSDRVSVDAESRPIVYDRVFIPGDRFRITRQLHYDRSVTA